MDIFIRKYNKENKYSKEFLGGYTIIETMISITVFITVMIAGMGTLLKSNVLHEKSEDLRSIIDNMSFILEDMSRNIRTGSVIHCYDDVNFPGNLTDPQSCVSGTGIAFESSEGVEGDGSDQWVYEIRGVSGGPLNLYKSTESGANGSWVQMNPDEVELDQVSVISVVGAEPLSSGDRQQPFVIIRLVGKITYKDNVVTPFSLQTSVSQRLIDL